MQTASTRGVADPGTELGALIGSGDRSSAGERRYRKQRVAGTLRLFAKFGFGEGAAGHVTARDPERPDHFWVNPLGRHFARITASDLVLVNSDGDLVAGEGLINRAAFAIHSRVHEARPDVVAACHTHSIYGRTFSTLGRLLDPITQDSCAFYEDLALFDDYAGPVVDVAEADRLAAALGPHKAAILRNHGLLSVGRTVEEAAWWYISLERSCQAQLMADAAGKPVLIDPAYAELTATEIGTGLAARINFATLWELIVAEQPDFLADTPSPAVAGKAKFGSPSWFAHLAAAFTQEIARGPVATDAFCYQEVLTGATPEDTVAWHVRLDGGHLASLGYGEPIDEFDLQTTIDRDVALPLALLPRGAPAFGALAERLVRDEQVSLAGDPARKQVFAELFERVHDFLAERTC